MTQLPFFVCACDYTLMGEELFAVGALVLRLWMEPHGHPFEELLCCRASDFLVRKR